MIFFCARLFCFGDVELITPEMTCATHLTPQGGVEDCIHVDA